MKTNYCLPLLAVSIFTCQFSTALAQGTAFTYQGRLNDGGAPANGAYDLRFAIYDSAANGTTVGTPLTNSASSVSNGLFVAQLDFGAGIFNGSPRWIEISVRTNGSTGGFATLSPRQQVTSAPYAIQAANAASALVAASANSVSAANISGTLALAQLPGGVVTNNNTGSVVLNGSFNGNGAGLTNLNASQLQTGVVPLNVLPGFQSPSYAIIGGGYGNVTSDSYTTVGGGFENAAQNYGATVSGGDENVATGQGAAIGGGGYNVASGGGAVISGGGWDGGNTASGLESVISGGWDNTASGESSTVAGGAHNLASGYASFAAGLNAKATNAGAFVWADSQSASFNSISNDSFNVRARGGVRFVTGGMGLLVDSQPVLTNNASGVSLSGSFTGNGGSVTNVNAVTLNGLAANSFWQLGGNNVANGQFIGSTNSQAVEIWAKTRALRLEPNASGAPNVIAGAPNNFVSGAVGATVGGGGANNYSIFNFAFTNRVTADFGTVSGGRNNAAGASDATVGGGYSNLASGIGATVSGGGYDGTTVAGNTASGGGAAVGGGNANTASGLLSVVSGGNNNRATNAFSTVPGGQFNTAGGAQSFAAGRKALATNDGAFVWADTTDAYFASAAKDSFNVRANGGARFVTGGTGLSVDGQTVFRWQVALGTAQQAQPNTGYVTTNNSLVTITLPTSANLGDVTRVSGNGAGGWRIAQNAGQAVSAQNLSGNIGLTWTGQATSQNWQCVASSGDGTKLVAGINNGQLYVSRDSGMTWGTPESTARVWTSAAFSADGTKFVATVYGGQIYTSSDSGATLTPQNSGNQFWYCVASSADGTKLVAGVRNGQIYTSSDSGVTWTAQNSGSQLWYSVASSADGTKLVAVPNGGQIFTSSNSGVSWTAQNSGSRSWYSAASSGDGTKLVAVVNGGQIYTSSDSGVTWTARATTQGWQSVASSADGTKLVAVVSGGQIFTSHDSGVTWSLVPDSFIRNWWSVASSADGTKLVAVVNGGPIFTSVPSSVPSTTAGATGYLLGTPNSAIELQFLGNGQFLPLSHEGIIQAF